MDNSATNKTSVLKQGSGTWTLSGSSANTYTGLTTVSAGELDLNKTASNGAIAGDILVNGGTLKWATGSNTEQVSNSSNITLSSGTVDLNGNSQETIGSFTNNGGTFTTGPGGLLFAPSGSITFAAGTNTLRGGFGTVESPHIIITGGTNIVEGATTLTFGGAMIVQTGGVGLEMTGSTLTLNSENSIGGNDNLRPGTCSLNASFANPVAANITSHASSVTSTIASGGSGSIPGTISLNGAICTFTVEDGAAAIDMSVSARLVNNIGNNNPGGLIKAGAGLLQLSGANTYTGTTTVAASGGTLSIDSGASGTGRLAGTSGITVNSGGTLLLAQTVRPARIESTTALQSR